MSELVEKVTRAIRVAALRAMHPDITESEIEDALRTRDVDYTPEARAAIAAVAKWLEGQRSPSPGTPLQDIINLLTEQLEQPK